MTSFASMLSGHLTMAAAPTSGVQTLRRAAARLRGLIPKAWTDPYRPELHYMRGPGPKWRERNAAAAPDYPIESKINRGFDHARGWPHGMNFA